MIGKLFLETIQMDAERALTANIVHAKEVIGALPISKTAEELGRHAAVSPINIPVVRITEQPAIISSQLRQVYWFFIFNNGYCLVFFSG